MTDRAVTPKSAKASAVVSDHLRERIARGEFQEGDPLPNESGIMEEYGVSRPTARSAIRILESEGLVVVRPGLGGGPRVRYPDVGALARQVSVHLELQGTTTADLLQARALIEPAAVRMLAQKRPQAAIARLRELHAQEVRLADDPLAFAEAAATFHEQLVELAGNRTLATFGRLVLELIEVQNRATVQRLRRPAAMVRNSVSHHAEVLRLIQAGDADAAETLWREHLEEGARLAVRALGARTPVRMTRTPSA